MVNKTLLMKEDAGDKALILPIKFLYEYLICCFAVIGQN